MKEWARSTNARYSSPRPRRKKSFMIWESCYPLVNKHSTYNVSDTVWYYVRILCLPASVPSDLSPPLTASISAVDVEEDRYRRLHQPQLVSVYWISFTSETKRWQSVAKACVSTRASVHDTHTHTHTHYLSNTVPDGVDYTFKFPQLECWLSLQLCQFVSEVKLVQSQL